MTISYFNYLQTYSNIQTYIDSSLSNSSLRVTTDISCQNLALQNQSPFFILSDYNETTGDASCSYGIVNSNNVPIYSDSSYADWISSLTPCVNNSSVTCSIEKDNTTFGTGNDFSLYASPLLGLLLSPDSPPQVNANYFNSLLAELDITNSNSVLQRYINHRTNYLTIFYQNISGVIETSGVKEWSYTTASLPTGLQDDLNLSEQYFSKLQTIIFQLNQEFNSILIQLDEYNRSLSISYKLLEIINMKIFYAEQFFNVLMNKNYGAIGELDITEYNRLLAIFNNIVITIVIFSSIYLYFKKNE